jgi:predicted Zn-ribbon and HTH transcriptional regulator
MHNSTKSTMSTVRPLPATYATVETVKELNAKLEELSARLDRYLAAQPTSTTQTLDREPSPEINRPKPAGLRCPQCNKRTFQRARRYTLGEKLSAILLMTPFRCRYCAHFEFRSIFTG